MALGMEMLIHKEAKIDSLVETLRRCLSKAAAEAADLLDELECCIEDDPCSLMPDGSPWPHCQHSISQDDGKSSEKKDNIKMLQYKDENDIAHVIRLMTKDLSEPYSIYTYRFFVHNWPDLCILAYDEKTELCVGAIVGKMEVRKGRRSGYVAMLAVDESCRRMGLGTRLVRQAIQNMQAHGCDEVYLETEVTNFNALGLYTKLGFIRDKRLIRYYLNGNDAYRLKLFLTSPHITTVH